MHGPHSCVHTWSEIAPVHGAQFHTPTQPLCGNIIWPVLVVGPVARGSRSAVVVDGMAILPLRAVGHAMPLCCAELVKNRPELFRVSW